jgi:hypothetical protein
VYSKFGVSRVLIQENAKRNPRLRGKKAGIVADAILAMAGVFANTDGCQYRAGDRLFAGAGFLFAFRFFFFGFQPGGFFQFGVAHGVV